MKSKKPSVEVTLFIKVDETRFDSETQTLWVRYLVRGGRIREYKVVEKLYGMLP